MSNRGYKFFVCSSFAKLKFFVFSLTAVLLLTSCADGIDGTEGGPGARTATGLVANAGARTVELSWIGAGSARSYTLYWQAEQPISDKSQANQIQVSDAAYYEHRGLDNGVTYYYRVSINSENGESALSSEVTATPRHEPPEKPDLEDGDGNRLIQTHPGDRRVTVNWPLDISEGAVRYTLLWQRGAGVSSTSAQRIEDVLPPFVHEGLDNGQLYSYRLVGVNDEGEGNPSDEVLDTPQKSLPVAPSELTAEIGDGQVTISWNDLSNAESYEVYWSTTQNVTSDSQKLTNVRSPFTHAPLFNGQPYYYRVLAINSHGASELSGELMATPSNANSPPQNLWAFTPLIGAEPDAPTDVSALPGDGQISLSWGLVNGAASYTILWSNGPGVDVNSNKIANISPLSIEDQNQSTRQMYVHTGLRNGQDYYYVIAALNNIGQTLSVQTPAIRPEQIKAGRPSNVRAIAGDGWIDARWFPVQNADSYNLYWKTENCDFRFDNSQANDYQSISNIEAPNYRIDNLDLGISHCIIIQALDGSGNTSLYSLPAQATPQMPPPSAPTGVIVSPGNTNVEISWDANPENESVSHYHVYWSLNPDVAPGNSGTHRADRGRGISQTQFNHTGLDNGVRYYYVVTAVNAVTALDVAGQHSIPSRDSWAVPQAVTPRAPAITSAQGGNGSITISWTPVQNATSYNLYWQASNNSGGRTSRVVVPNAGALTSQAGADYYQYILSGLQNDTVHYLKISAFNGDGEGAFSKEVSSTPFIAPPTVSPQIQSIEPKDGEVEITWDTPALPSEEVIESYSLYWSVEPDFELSESYKVENILQPRYVHENRANGTTYYYRVVTVNGGGEGPVSDLQIATPQVPSPADAPSEINAVAGDAQVQLSWQPDVPGADYYNIYFSTDLEQPTQLWTLLAGFGPSDVHGNLTNGLTYHYYIRAANAGGEGPDSNIVSAQPQVPPPAAPTGVSASSGNAQAILNWDVAPSLEYNVYRSASESVVVTPNNRINPNPVNPAFIDSGLVNGTSYYYVVTASNAGGESPASYEVIVTPQTPVVGAPVGVSALGRDGAVELRWMPPQGADASTTYNLYWSDNSNAGTNTTILPNVQFPFIHANRANGTTYYYTIKAVNDGIESPASNPVQATPLPPSVGTPSGLNAQAEEGRVRATWNSVAGAQSYKLYWSTTTNDANPEFFSISATTTQYVHQNLINGTTYYYRISAVNPAGESSLSAWRDATPTAAINRAPVISNGTSINENVNQGATLTLSLNATDLDSDTLTWQVDPNFAPANGLVQLSPSSGVAVTLSYTHTANNLDGESFWVQVMDGNGGEDRIQILISINWINNAPIIATPSVANIDENTTDVVQIEATDPDSETVSFDISGGIDAALFDINPASGALVFQVAPDFEIPADSNQDNNYQVVVSADDGSGLPNSVATLALTITVLDVNDAPTITSQAITVATQGEVYTYPLEIEDQDINDTHLFSLLTFPQGMAIDENSGVITWAPGNAEISNTPYDVEARVMDGAGETGVQLYQVTVVDTNEPPQDVLIDDPDIPGSGSVADVGENVADSTIIGVLSAIDPDPVQDFSFRIIQDSSGGAFAITKVDATTSLLIVQNSVPLNFETNPIHTVDIQVNDGGVGGGLELPVAKLLTINLLDQPEPPNIDPVVSPIPISENSVTVTTITASDPEGDPVQWSISGGVDAAQFDALSFAATAELRFVTAPNYESPADNGGDNIYNLIVSAGDGALSSTLAISIQVTDEPESPAITSTPQLGASQNVPYIYQVQVDDDDLVNGDSLIFSLPASPGGMTVDPDTGIINWTPTNAQVSPPDHSVQVRVDDSTGLFDEQTFTISVSDLNEPPFNLQIDNAQVGENEAVNTVVGAFTVEDPDVTDTQHTFLIIDDPSGAFGVSGNQLTVIDPLALNFENATSHTLQIQAEDDEFLRMLQPAQIVIQIANQNDLPFVADQSFPIIENITAAGDVAANDEDNDPFDYIITGGLDASLFNINPQTGALSFITAPNFESPNDSNGDGIYEVDIAGDDGSGSGPGQAGVITVTVQDANDQPDAVNDSYTVNEGATLVELPAPAPFGVLANDSDEDADTLTVSIQNAPNYASAFNLNADGSFSYTHDGSETTIDTFTYLVNDNTGETNATNTATVTINITPQNDRPVIIAQIPAAPGLTSPEDADITLNLGNLSVTDADNLTYPAGFTLNVLPNPASNYSVNTNIVTPDLNYNGTLDVLVTVNDGADDSDPFTVLIDVTAVPDAPEVVNPIVNQNPPTAQQGTPYSFQFAINTFNDVDGDTLTYTAQVVGGGQWPSWLTFDDVNREFRGLPQNADVTPLSGIDIEVIADDNGNGGTVSDVFNLVVTNVNDPIQAVPDTAQLIEDNATNFVTGDVVANDIDLDVGDAKTLNQFANQLNPIDLLNAPGSINGSYGTLTWNNDNTYTYTLSNNNATVNALRDLEQITDQFDYIVSDGIATDTSTLTVTIVGNNDAPTATITSPQVTQNISFLGQITFVGEGDDAEDSNLDHRWSFGAGSGLSDITNLQHPVLAPDQVTVTFPNAGNFNVTLTVTDADGVSIVSSSVIVNVSANVPPTAVIDQPSSGVTLNIDEQVVLDATSSSDSDGHTPLTYQWDISGPAFSTINSGSPTSTVSFATAGTYTVNLTVYDSESLASINAASIQINVNAPPIAVGDAFTVLEGLSYVSGVASLLTNDTDPEGGGLTANTTPVTMPSNGILTLSSSGTYSYTHDGSETLTDSFEYEVIDDFGATATAIVDITVTPQNDAPVFNNVLGAQTDADGATNINIDASASDVDVGDVLIYSAIGLPLGIAIDSATGVVSGDVTVGASVNSPHNVTITVDDQNAEPNSVATANFIWTVNPLSLTGLFSDPGLQACIDGAALANGWSFAHEVVTTADTPLDCSNQNIQNLAGVQHLVNLTYLMLDNNPGLTDVTLLSSLPLLEQLDFGFNGLISIDAVAGLSALTNITTLRLYDNQISDISPLSSLSGLQSLILWNNNISDLSVVAGFSGLQQLWLMGNPVQNVGGLSSLPSLIDLGLSGLTVNVTSPTQITGLDTITNLEILWMQDNALVDLAGIDSLINLRELWVLGNAIRNVSTLSGLINLTSLGLGANGITVIGDVVGLTSLSNVQVLWMPNNGLGNITNLSNMIQLTELYLSGNAITDVIEISSLTSLQQLYLVNNNIGGTGSGNVDTLTALTAAQRIAIDNNLPMDCLELEALNNFFGGPGNTVVSPNTVLNGVNCTNQDATPNVFSFTPLTDQPLSSVIASNTVTITGINTAAPISIVGGEYAIDGGTYTNVPGTITNGQTVQVRQTSSAQPATTTTATLTIGGVNGAFNVTTVPADSTPNAFAFTAQTNVALSSVATSNAITVGGINSAAPISISGGTYAIDGGAYTNAPGSITNGQTVQVRQTASAQPATTTTATLTIGGVNGAFNVTTVPADTTPNAFAFTAQTNVALSAVATSDAITVGGINSAAPISVSGGTYAIDGGAYTNAPGTITNGQTVQVRQTSSAQPAITTTATLTIGGVNGAFNVTTVPADTIPNAFAFTAQTNVALSAVATSNAITVGGINSAAPISISGGTYSINGGAYTSAAGSITNGQTVQVRQTSSAQPATTTTATLTIGGVNGAFNVTTVLPPNTPPTATIDTPSTDRGVAINAPFSFVGSGTDAEDLPIELTYSWDFGVGSGIPISNSQNPNPVTYTTTGTYTVTLTVTDTNNAASSATKTIVVADTWGSPELIENLDDNLVVPPYGPDAAAYNPRLAIDGSNNVFAVWQQSWLGDGYNKTIANRYDATTGLWGTAAPIDNSPNFNTYAPKIVVTPGGTAIATWRQWQGTYYNIWYNRYNPGSGWATPLAQVESTTNQIYYYDMAQDSVGNVRVIWGEVLPANGLSRMTGSLYSMSTNTWGTAQNLEATFGNSFTPIIDIGGVNGTAALTVWNGGGLYSNAVLGSTTAWSTTNREVLSFTTSISDPKVLVLNNDDGLSVWSSNNNLYWSYFDRQGVVPNRWSAAQIVANGFSSATKPYIDKDSSNRVMLVFQGVHTDGRSGVWASRYTGTWSVPEPISYQSLTQVAVSSAVVAMDSVGNAIAVWRQGLNTWASSFNATTTSWGIARLIETSATGSGDRFDIKFDQNDVGVVVWSQGHPAVMSDQSVQTVISIYSTRLQ